MKITINKKILKDLKPCINSWENYLKNHSDFDGDFLEFLALENIPAKDKVWVAVRLLPRYESEVFAIDCSVNAAAYAAAYAADAAVADAAAADALFEQERQLDALSYLYINIGK